MRRTALVVAAVSAALTACVSSPPAEPLSQATTDPAAARTEVRVAVCPPGPLFPPDNLEICGSEILAQLWTPLVIVDPEGMPRPALAGSVEQLDATTWELELRQGWTFHDGTPVTAQAVADGWAVAATGGFATSSYLEPVERVDVDAERTLTVHLDRPFSQLPLLLSFNPFFPLAAATLDAPSGEVIGTGPWRVSADSGEGLVLDAYPGYAGPPPPVDRVRYVYADEAEAWALFEGGEVDVAQAPRDEWDRLSADGSFVPAASATLEYLLLPIGEGLEDQRIRQALSLALDRQALAQEVRDGAARPATGFVAPAAGGRDALCDVCRHDPERARALLDEAGGEVGPFVLTGNDPALLEAVAAQWEETLGVQATVGAGDGLPVQLNLWLMDYPSPQNFLQPLFATGGAVNSGGYSNADVDALIALGDAAPTLADATAAYRRAEDLLLDDLPAIPLLFPTTGFASQGPVSRLVVDRAGVVALRAIELE